MEEVKKANRSGRLMCKICTIFIVAVAVLN